MAPAVLGIFWGGPLVARELETGTYRLVWNQSVTRGHWLAAKLGLSVVATTLAVGILTLAVTWWAHPIDGALSSRQGSLPSRLSPISFAMRGIVPVSYAVFALVLATLVGLVLRRSLAAMAVTLAIYVFVQIAVPLWVRPHLVPPTSTATVISGATLDGIRQDNAGTITLTTRVTPGDWVLSNQTVDAARTPHRPPRLVQQLSPAAARPQPVDRPADRGSWPRHPGPLPDQAERRGLPAARRLPAEVPLLATPVGRDRPLPGRLRRARGAVVLVVTPPPVLTRSRCAQAQLLEVSPASSTSPAGWGRPPRLTR